MNAIEPLSPEELKQLLGDKEILVAQLTKHVQAQNNELTALREQLEGKGAKDGSNVEAAPNGAGRSPVAK